MFKKACFGILVILQVAQSIQDVPCNYTAHKGDGAYLFYSPDYPKMSKKSSCRYKIIGPEDHEMELNCSLETMANDSKCEGKALYVSPTGDLEMRDAQKICGKGNFTRTYSFSQIALTFESTDGKAETEGRVLCELTIRPQSCDCGWMQKTRIVGGTNATLGEYPSMVAIYDMRTSPSRLLCGGTIINHRYVLTARHCTYNDIEARDMLIVAGFTDVNSPATEYASLNFVEKIIKHPRNGLDSRAYDVALLKTTKDINWSQNVGPICLPFGAQNTTFEGFDVDLIGWGKTSFGGSISDELKTVTVKVISNKKCKRRYSITSSDLCTYAPHKDGCQFDSGGPVIHIAYRQYLLGVISYGKDCGTTYGVNTRVTSVLDWITRNTEGHLCHK